ncbi:MAG: Dabb family protein [Pseudomonadota bacterium]
MFVHAVFFWLKDSTTPEQHGQFEQALLGLLKIDTIRHGFVGIPADTHTPEVERSYSFGLTVIFNDLFGHDRYQVDPIHQAFVDQWGQWIDKVQVYDAQ